METTEYATFCYDTVEVENEPYSKVAMDQAYVIDPGAIVVRRFIFQTSLFAFLYNDLLLCTGHKTGFNESSLATDTSHVCNVKANVSQEHVILYIYIQLTLTNMHNIACCFKTVSFLFVVYLLVL